MCYQFGGLIFGGAYTWRGLFSEFYGKRIKEKKEINGFDRKVRWSRELSKPLLYYEPLYYEWKYLICALGARYT